MWGTAGDLALILPFAIVIIAMALVLGVRK